MLGPCLRAGCAQAVWALVGGGRWSRATRNWAVLGGGSSVWASGGPDGAVSSRGAELVGVRWLFQGCCSGGRLGPSAHAA